MKSLESVVSIVRYVFYGMFFTTDHVFDMREYIDRLVTLEAERRGIEVHTRKYMSRSFIEDYTDTIPYFRKLLEKYPDLVATMEYKMNLGKLILIFTPRGLYHEIQN